MPGWDYGMISDMKFYGAWWKQVAFEAELLLLSLQDADSNLPQMENLGYSNSTLQPYFSNFIEVCCCVFQSLRVSMGSFLTQMWNMMTAPDRTHYFPVRRSVCLYLPPS